MRFGVKLQRRQLAPGTQTLFGALLAAVLFERDAGQDGDGDSTAKAKA